MLVLKEFYTYLIRKKTNQHTSTPNCYEINFLKSRAHVKGFVGDQFILRSKQAKRLKKLLMKIETFEKSLSKNLLQDIVNELYHLGISPEQLE